ncbi:hypothetical protein [Haliangium sp.]|uniref:hypothetical protein n=1 Tax=Haliangium sp. TaxID=2663208 RepID=UPI003D1527C8
MACTLVALVSALVSALVPAPVSAQTTAQEAGQRGMDYLSAAALEWQTSHEACFACHTQGMSLWGASIGKGRGYDVDTDVLSALVTLVRNTQGADGAWSHSSGVAKRLTTGLAASGLSFYDRFVSTDAQSALLQGARWMLSQQSVDGHWVSDSVWDASRSEIFRDHQIYLTAMANILMQRAYEITGDRNYAAARARGLSWLRQASASSTQALAFQLIGLVEAKLATTDSVLESIRSQLLGNQNPNGSFGTFAGSTGSPYHTGLGIYALRLAGVSRSAPAISAGMDWLIAQQTAEGSWPRGGALLDATDRVAPSMWPTIALGEFSELGVNVDGVPEEMEVPANAPASQTIEYVITIANAGSGDRWDTYDLFLSGGMSGFSATLSPVADSPSEFGTSELWSVGEITLEAGAAANLILTVDVPPNLPSGLSVIHTVVARSHSDPDVVSVVSVTTTTSSTFPAEGRATTTSLLSGAGQTINTRDTLHLAAEVHDTVTQETIRGDTDAGTVIFVVAGIAVGSDVDADGDGIFELDWTPGETWPRSGVQNVLASYSGIAKLAPGVSLAPSFASGSLELNCHGSFWSACTPTCPCGDGMGDCDADSDCVDDARCLHDAGLSYGYDDPEVDVCGVGCPSIDSGAWNLCTVECPCAAGYGDCDADADCVAGLVCRHDVGADYGLDPEVDVCEAP